MRVLHYSHDQSGTGYIRKTLAVADQVALDFPQVTQLLVSETPQPRGVRLPHQLDFIKLPSTDNIPQNGFHDPSLLLPPGVSETLREELILSTIKHFHPDLVLVQAEGRTQRAIFYVLKALESQENKIKVLFGWGDIQNAVFMVRETLSDTQLSRSHFFTAEDFCEENQHNNVNASLPRSTQIPSKRSVATASISP